MNEALFFVLYGLSHQSAFLDGAIVFFAVYFPFLVLALASLVLLFKYKSFREPAFALFFAAFGWALAHVFKFLFRTARPDLVFPETVALFQADGFAFPSGHAAFFFALAMMMYFFHRRAAFWFFAFALLVGLARIAGGVHFPIDILGGLALGVLSAELGKLFYRRFANPPHKV
jgi:undecaprenyl-diphosphatase